MTRKKKKRRFLKEVAADTGSYLLLDIFVYILLFIPKLLLRFFK